MLYTNKYKNKLNKGANMINEVNSLYLKGDIGKAELIKRELRKIRGIDVANMVHRARSIREI